MSDEKRVSYLETFFRILIKAAVLNGGTIYEAAQWRSAVVVVPPGRDVANPVHFLPAGGLSIFARIGIQGTFKMLFEFPRAVGRYKNPALGKSDCYYIFIVATIPEGRGQGLASKILREVLQVAQKEQKPAWLEATSETSKRVYAKLGFQELGSVTLGKGKSTADGQSKTEGPGIKIWPMIWHPRPNS
ncbi:hypothetical protein PWT90_06462 [Aphanocladium album]|nr:hypothetical protein PWT90_06462 [Aphanocladium album]